LATLLTKLKLIKMKKVLLSLFVVAALASCKKERDCVCTTSVLGTNVSTTTVIKDTKKKAKEKCDEGDVTTAFGSVACELK
jgi:hypothetical protein